MRPIFVTLIVAALLLGVAVPAYAGVRIEHRAEATFLLPKRDGVRPAFFVSALRMTGYGGNPGPVGSLNIGFTIHRGGCPVGGGLASCWVSDRAVGGNFRDGDVFEIDDDLETARLRVQRRGTTHTIRWRATTDPAPIVRDADCGLIPVGVASGAQRFARASGRVFDHNVTKAVDPWTVLSTTAYSC